MILFLYPGHSSYPNSYWKSWIAPQWMEFLQQVGGLNWIELVSTNIDTVITPLCTVYAPFTYVDVIFVCFDSCYGDASKTRNRLIMPSINSTNIFIFDTGSDPRAPSLHKVHIHIFSMQIFKITRITTGVCVNIMQEKVCKSSGRFCRVHIAKTLLETEANTKMRSLKL